MYKYEWGSCRRKRRFRTKKSALNAMKTIRKRHIVVREINIYKCEFCNGYHITSMHQV